MADRTVQLFVTCLVDGFYPEVGEATVELLERAGCRVEFPFDQTCCGQPAFNGGFREEAVAMARHTLEVLDATEGDIATPSGSCASMIVHHFHELVAEDPQLSSAATRVAARTHELTQYLVDVLGVLEVAGATQSTVAYHPSCHGLRSMGLDEQPLTMIDSVSGPDRVPLPDAETCCGFGGLFSIKMPEVSAAMLQAKIANIEASGADVIAGTDVSCLMHISGGLRRAGSTVRTCHVAELIAGRVP